MIKIGKFFFFGVLVSIIFGAFSGNLEKVSAAALEESTHAAELSIKLLGSLCFWSGIMETAKQSGFVDLLSGDVNWPNVMEQFKKIGYDDWVTAEMLPPYTYYPETIIYNTSNAMDKIIGR